MLLSCCHVVVGSSEDRKRVTATSEMGNTRSPRRLTSPPKYRSPRRVLDDGEGTSTMNIGIGCLAAGEVPEADLEADLSLLQPTGTSPGGGEDVARVQEDQLMPFRRQKSVKDMAGGIKRRQSVASMDIYMKASRERLEGSEAVTMENVTVPLHVVRGPDWKWGNQDGGVGQVGIINRIDQKTETVTVFWESTKQEYTHYRIGRSSRDLVLANGERQAAASSSPRIDRRNSQAFFSQKTQTCIILDWDDTLFPTTYVRDDLELCWRRPMKDQNLDPSAKAEIGRNLAKCAENVRQLLRSCSQFGKVILVTLAKSPWVAESCKNFYPAIGQLIRELEVPVIYAQDGIQHDYQKAKFQSDQEAEKYWSMIKGKAIARELRDFYSQYEGQSWKNIISIGDSDFERLGTQYATEDYMRETGIMGKMDLTEVGGHVYKVRTKTFKMLDQPTIEELTVEVAMVHKWLPLMVKLDNGFDVNLNDVEDPRTLQTIERTLRGLPILHEAGV
mmetsp:Transcript_105852/g.225930  ORF Transcript_105852/g.225930 Transcript_105852/m.225930 type:complete len:502 (-) Transcript_105852:30-1535(-)